MKQGNANLSVGTPWKILLAYTLPLLGSAVFQQIYTIADTVIAGKFAGESALAAVGASMSIVNILMAVALGANAGCAVLAARYFGAKDTRRTLSCILSSFVGFFTLSVVLMGAGFLSSGPVLSALRTPDSVMKESVLYLKRDCPPSFCTTSRRAYTARSAIRKRPFSFSFPPRSPISCSTTYSPPFANGA